MKKLVLSVLVLFFFGISADATMVVTYNTAGAPVSYRIGAGPAITPYQMNNMVQNRYKARPGIAPRGSIRSRNNIPQRLGIAPCGGMQQLPPMAYRTRNYNAQSSKTVAVKNAKYVQPISRFNKNYSISSPQKTYVKNGVTYYN